MRKIIKKILIILLIIIILAVSTVSIYIFIENKRCDFISQENMRIQYYYSLERYISCAEKSGIIIEEEIKVNIRKDIKKFVRKIDNDYMLRPIETFSLARLISVVAFFEVDTDYQFLIDLLHSRYDEEDKLFSNGIWSRSESDNNIVIVTLYDTDVDISMADDYIIDRINNLESYSNTDFSNDITCLYLMNSVDQVDINRFRDYVYERLESVNEDFINYDYVPLYMLACIYNDSVMEQQMYESLTNTYKDLTIYPSFFESVDGFVYFTSFVCVDEYDFDYYDENAEFVANANSNLKKIMKIAENELMRY